MPETKKGKNAMKIRNNSRILALVLALVMILPLISIPVFADGETEVTPLFSENFDGKALADVIAGTPAKSAVITGAVADAAAHGDTLQLTIAGVGAADYYLWQNNNNKWPISDGVVSEDGKKISGTANGITITEATINPGDDLNSPYAVGGTNYYVVTGAYADSMGGFTNVAAATKFKNPAIAVADHPVITIELDIYLPEGMKNTSGVSGRLQGTKTAGGSQNIELFEITADGTNAKINKHENGTIGKGEAKTVALGAWVNLIFEVDITNKKIGVLVNEEFAFQTSVLANSYADISSLNADSLQVQVDRGGRPSTNAGDVQFDNVSIISGTSGIKYNPDAIKPVIIDFEDQTLDAAPDVFAALGVKDSKVVDTYGSKAWEIPFVNVGGTGNTDAGDLNVDCNPKIKNPAVSYDSHDKIVYEISYFFPTDASGQIQNQFTSSTACVNGAAAQSSVAWVDLYQIAFSGGSATLVFEGGTNASKAILEATGVETDNKSSYTFATGKWNTVSLVIDLDTGIYEVYVNGALVFDYVQLYKGGILTNVTIAASQMIIGGKVNKILGSGSFQLDNIKFFEGDAPSVEYVEKEVEDFSDYKWIVGQTAGGLSVPSLATYKAIDDNVVVNIPLAATRNSDNTYALLRGDGRNVYAWGVTIDEADETIIHVPDNGPNGAEEFNVRVDEWAEEGYEGMAYAWFEYEGEFILTDGYLEGNPAEYAEYAERYYLVPEAVAELAVGSSNHIAKAFKIFHNKYTYMNDDIVVLSADYFIEAGSKGIIEAQFESYYYDTVEGEGEEAVTTSNLANWIQLYYFDTATGQFEGLNEYMTIGAWNNVKVFLDLDNGVFEIYLNGVLVKTEEVGHTNLTIGQNAASSFSVAKIQRTTALNGEIAGNLMVDNVGISTNVPADSQYGDGYLSDEAYLNSLGKLLLTVNDPTVRLEDPNGLRFVTKIDDAFMAQLLANLGEDAIVGMGTLIAPLDYVELAGAFTKGALDAIEAPTDAKYLDIPFAEYFDGAAGADFGEGNFFTASIVEIKDENLMRDFAAIAYVMVEVAEGDVRTCYAKSYATASAAYAAKKVLANSETFDWTEEQLAVLNGFADADTEYEIWVESPLGNSKYPVSDVMPMEEFEAIIDGRTFFGGRYAGCSLTIKAEADFTVRYGDEILTSVEGVLTIDELVANDEYGMMTLFAILEAGTYTIYVESPLGTMENPIVIESLAEALTVAVPENSEGIYYVWIADGAGILTVTGATAVGNVTVYNEGNGAWESVEGTASVVVPYAYGDKIEFTFNTAMDFENWTSPAADVTISFATQAATMLNMPAINAQIAPGEFAVFEAPNRLAGYVFTLEDATGIAVWYNGEFQFADDNGVITFKVVSADNGTCTFTFRNNREEALELNVVFTEPVGSMGNPADLVVGDNEIAIAEDNRMGYNLIYNSAADETLTFAITDITEGAEVDVVVQAGAVLKSLLADGIEGVLTVDVAAGTEVIVIVVETHYAAADVIVTVTSAAE